MYMTYLFVVKHFSRFGPSTCARVSTSTVLVLLTVLVLVLVLVLVDSDRKGSPSWVISMMHVRLHYAVILSDA